MNTVAILLLRLLRMPTRRRLVLVLGTLVPMATPAHAGNGFWSSEPCNPDVEWYGTSYGVWYWLWGYSESHGAQSAAVPQRTK